MKKLFITIIAVFYFGVSSGATLYAHFCMGEITGIDLAAQSTGDCGNCGMNKSEAQKCCDQKQQKLEADTAQKIALQNHQFTVPFLYHLIVNSNLGWSSFPEAEKYHSPTVNSATANPDVPVFIRNCNFRI